MTPDDELALLWAQNAVLLAAVREYKDRENWFAPYALSHRTWPNHCFRPNGKDSTLEDGWLPAERALAEYERLEAEAGRKVVGNWG